MATTYKVQKGDTLSQIAKNNGTTVAEIAKANNISNVNLIYTGQNLTIPSTATSKTASTAPQTSQKQSAGAAAPSVSSAPASSSEVKFDYGAYEESPAVKRAEAALEEHNASKPSELVPSYDAQIDEIMNQIFNREEFSYDLDADALYRQYRDQYSRLGKTAMMDTMGQAAALTGGYGNSYASTAGNQAYQAYLSQLNDVVPELYGMALDRYNAEGDELYRQYSLLTDADSREYERYTDALNTWLTERDYLDGRYDAERDYDYGKYSDDRDFRYGVFADDRSYKYQQERDAASDAQYAEQFEYEKERDAISDARWQTEYDLALESAAAEGSSVSDETREMTHTEHKYYSGLIDDCSTIDEVYALADQLEALGYGEDIIFNLVSAWETKHATEADTLVPVSAAADRKWTSFGNRWNGVSTVK